jgi:hypothetical protein
MSALKKQIEEMMICAMEMVGEGIQCLRIKRGDNVYHISQHIRFDDDTMETIAYVRIARFEENQFIRPFSKAQQQALNDAFWIVNCEPKWRGGEARKIIPEITSK